MLTIVALAKFGRVETIFGRESQIMGELFVALTW